MKSQWKQVSGVLLVCALQGCSMSAGPGAGLGGEDEGEAAHASAGAAEWAADTAGEAVARAGRERAGEEPEAREPADRFGQVFGSEPSIDSACTGDPLGSFDYCSTSCPCEVNEGDCDSDAQCVTGLVCMRDTGALFGLDPELDTCMEQCSPDALGTPDFCSPECPCEAGQADCDEDEDCAPGNVCAKNVGASYGYAADVDVCVDVCDPLFNGSFDYCSPGCPCEHGQGDCDSDADCAPGHVCARDAGGSYGFDPEMDVCESVSQDFSGRVIDDRGNGVSGAEVSIDGVSTETGEDGSFALQVASGERHVINVTKNGYVPVSRVHVGSGATDLVLIASRAEAITLDPSQPVDVADSAGTRLVLGANALVDEIGEPPSGPVTVQMHTYNLLEEEMVGNMEAVDENGQEVMLESVGAVSADFVGENGQHYQLAPGHTALISIEVPDEIEFSGPIPMWYYDKAQGRWIEEGMGMVQDGVAYGFVSHFSVWNFDIKWVDPACVKVVVPAELAPPGSTVQARVVVPPPFPRTRTVDLEPGDNVLFNLPPDTEVQIFVPADSETPLAMVNTGAAWGGRGLPPAPYDVCNGEVTLTVALPGQIVGFALLQGRTVYAGTTMQVRDDNGAVVATTSTDESGQYTVTLDAGSYTVELSRLSYLRAVASATVLDGKMHFLSCAQLPGGDVNEDERIDNSDLDLVLAALGSSASPGDPLDVNGDGVIDSRDLGLVQFNLGLEGPLDAGSPGSQCADSVCGDGTVYPPAGEECDDGGETATCDADCTAAACGDGTTNTASGEECDDGGATVTCDVDCTAAVCGDGTRNAVAGEQCDHGGESATCDVDCTAALCGDGLLNPMAGEQCDDGNTISGDGCGATCAPEVDVVPIDLGGELRLASWVDVAFDPSDPDALYVVGASGHVLKSTDTGQTWRAQCALSLSNAASTQLFVSSDGAAYVGSSSRLYRVDPLEGAPCTNLTGPGTTIPGAVYIQSSTSNVAIAPGSGHLYVWEYAGTASLETLHRSVDGGATWSQLPHGLETEWASYRANMAIDPRDEGHVIMVRRRIGVFRRTTPAVAFNEVPTATFNGLDHSIKFDPAHLGYVYSNAGYYSSDNGATWLANSNYVTPNDWVLDAGGAGYRLTQSGTNIVLERAVDMRAPSWTALPGGLFAGFSPQSRVDVNGSRIAVIASGRLYLSTNGGTTFDQVTAPFEAGTMTFFLETLDSPDGIHLVGGSEYWSFVRSDDGGVSWAQGYSTGHPGEPPRVRVNPADPSNVYVYAFDISGSTYDRQCVVSHDGLSSGITYDNGVYGWLTTTAMSVSDPDILYGIGVSNSFRSFDGGGEKMSLPGSFPNVWRGIDGYVSPTVQEVLWLLDGGDIFGNQRLYEFDSRVDTALVDVTSRIGDALNGDWPAGIEMYDAGDGTYPMRIISSMGNLAQSIDEAQTFTPVGANSSLPSCGRRELRSLPSDRNVIATACHGTYAGAAWSTDGGQTWNRLTDTGWTSYGCNVGGLALTESAIIFACQDKPPAYVVHSPPTCGDGAAHLPEQCDAGGDNSDAPGATCRTDCTNARCGDGILDASEMCDDGNADDGDGCTRFCTVCGDGVVQPGEQCDQGSGNSNAPGATCRTDCTLARCGDGVQEPGEFCDDNNAAGGDGCRADCQGAEICGDGVVDVAAGEGCDDGAGNSDLMADACRTDCTGPRCGDGVLDSNEECDDGNTTNGDGCLSYCLFDDYPESSCNHEDDDLDSIVDEGCGGASPPGPIAAWTAYDFAYHDFRIGCSGERYIKETGYATGQYVGVILCSPTRYKILLAESPDEVFYSIGDGGGTGEDHCEFVAGSYVDHDARNNAGQLGYKRSSEGQTPVFGPMNGAHYTASWHECGVSIP